MLKSFRSGEGRGRKKRLSDMWYVAQKLESVLCHPGIFVTSAIKCEEEVFFKKTRMCDSACVRARVCVHCVCVYVCGYMCACIF